MFRFKVNMLVGLLLLGGLGCGGASADLQGVVPTKLAVFHKNQPVAGGEVRLHPVTEAAGKTPARPGGIIDADGTVQLTSYRQHDGAPPGDYIVTVDWAPVIGVERGENERREPDRFKGRHADPKSSKLRVSIARDTPQPIRIDVP